MSREVEKLGKRIAFLEETLNSLLRNGTGLGHSSFEDGAIEQYTDGVLGSQFGTQFDGTNGVFSVNGPVPPTPAFTSNSGDPVSAVIGGLLIRWEGFFEGGDTVVAPMDFSHVEIYASQTPTPSLLYPYLRSTLHSARGGSSLIPLPADLGGWYVWMVARSASGRPSAFSEVLGPFTPRLVDENDLAFSIAALQGSQLFWGDTAPTTDKIGDLWLKLPDEIAYRWKGPDGWVAVPDQVSVVDAMKEFIGASALAAPGEVQLTITDAVSLVAHAQDLANAAQTTATQASSDAAAANSLATLAKTTADSKVTVYRQTSLPTGGSYRVNDLWMDTDDGNKMYVWNGAWTATTFGLSALNVTARQLGAFTIYKQASAPTTGVLDGDYWIDDDDGNKAYVRASGAWVVVQDTAITTALTNATAAQTTANSKVTVFTQISAPSTTGRTVGDIWIDTDDSNVTYSWDGTQWVKRQIASGAIAPHSLIASDVIATGTVSAALLEAVLVIANAFVAGDPNGNQVRLDANGLRTRVLDPDGQLVDGSSFTPFGADRLMQIDSTTGRPLASITNGAAAFTDLKVEHDPIFQGNTLSYLLGQKPLGLLRKGGLIASQTATTTALGCFDIEFTAVPGRSYQISTSPLQLTPSTTATYSYAQLRVRPSADGAPTVSTGIPVSTANAMISATGAAVSVTLNRSMNFDEMFPVGSVPTVPTKVRVLLCYGVQSGGGSVGIFSNSTYPIHLYIEDNGLNTGYTGVVNSGGGGGTATPVVTTQLDFAQAWGGNYQSSTTAPRTDQQDMIQGYTSYYPGPGSEVAMMGFPDLTPYLSGSTINWMALWLNASWWNNNAGGTVLLGAHPYLNAPASRPSDWQLNLMQVNYSGKSGGQWIYIPSTWFTGFANGANRGFTLGDLASTAAQYYGRFYSYPSDLRPVLRVNYTK